MADSMFNNYGQGTLAQWKKFTKTYTDLAAAALTNDIELFKLNPREIILQAAIKHSASFTGGLIASYTISLGISGTLTKYLTAFDVFQAPGDGVSEMAIASGVTAVESFASQTSIRIAATATVGLLNTATAGSVDVWVLVGELP